LSKKIDKQQKLLDEVKEAIEVLPFIAKNLADYTIDSVEPYAQRIILATVLLQEIEAKLYAGLWAEKEGGNG
jgi:hypothetical protein